MSALDLLRLINEARRIGQSEAAEIALNDLKAIDCECSAAMCAYWLRPHRCRNCGRAGHNARTYSGVAPR